MKVLTLVKKTVASLGHIGLRATCWKVGQRLRATRLMSQLRVKPYTAAEIAAQRSARLKGASTIAVVIDAQDAKWHEVNAVFDSLMAQTYTDWRLYVKNLAPSHGFTDERVSVLEQDDGYEETYVALLSRGITLHPCALYEAMRAMTEKKADLVYTDGTDAENKPLYKPDYAPDTLRSMNYMGDFMVVRKTLLDQSGGIGKDGLYGLTLRLSEHSKRIEHVQRLLYATMLRTQSDSKEDVAAICAHMARTGLKGEVKEGRVAGIYRQCYELTNLPLVSILIPNKDHVEDLEKCIASIKDRTTYPNWEIVMIENNSTEEKTFACYERLEQDDRIRVVTWKDDFNYAAINNFGETFAQGDYLLMLNNDVEVITPQWIEEMLMFAQRSDVGAVGAMLYYPDDTVQHAGVIVGLGGVADHAHKGFVRGAAGYMNRMAMAQNYSAVTAACMFMRRSVYRQMGGFDTSFQVAFNDVDLCMRLGEAGYRIVWTPYAELYHYESKSRGTDETRERFFRYAGEVDRFQKRWMHRLLKGDPCYNRNLTQKGTDFVANGAKR